MAEVEAPRKVGQYILGETLGKGGYSWVKKGIDEKTRYPVALKFMIKETDKARDRKQTGQVKTEIKSLIRINSPHVMKLYAYNLNCKYPDKTGQELNTILLVLEYCPGGELFDILYYTQQLDAITARTYFIQMLKGIRACHDAGIVHRDIKPQNLLLDGHYQLKLTDFGLSFLGKEDENAAQIVMKTNYVGTRGYQAPELLSRSKYSKACDVFSAGVVLFILLTGYPPFEQATKTDKWYKPLADNNPAKFWKQHEGCGVDKDCQEMLSGMLAYKAQHRLSMEEVLKHKWSKGDVHDKKKLYEVVRKRHKETRARRRRDKKKMSDMQNSVKEKKRSGKDKLDVSELKLKCPVISAREALLKHNFMTYYCSKDHINDAYEMATLAFDIALKGNAVTKVNAKNPWCSQTTMEASATSKNSDAAASKHTWELQNSIFQIKETEEYVFEFRRIKGPGMPLFGKIWENVEAALLSHVHDKDRVNVFYDEPKAEPSAEEAPAVKFVPQLGDLGTDEDEDDAKEEVEQAPAKAPANPKPQAVSG